MKNLRKFKTEEEYNQFLRMPDSDLSDFICLVGTKVEYHDEDVPFYIEAIDDIVISYNTIKYYNYSYDNINYKSISTALSVDSGKRVFLQLKSSETYNKPIRVQGNYNVGGTISNDKSVGSLFENEAGLISAENLTIIGALQGSKVFSGCVNLVKGPRIFSSRTLSQLQGTNMFDGCTSLIEAPLILMNGWIDGTWVYTSLEYMFRGCSSLSKIVELMPSFPINHTSQWVSGVASEGTYILNANQYTRDSRYLPVGWQVKLYDMTTKKVFTKFKIGNTYYTANDNMTWNSWISSVYNTLGLRIEEDTIVNDNGVLMLGNKPVLPTDPVVRIAGTDYTITPIETETPTE